MSAISNFLELEILDHVFNVGAYTAPSIYCALFSTTPTESAFGTEVSDANYARQRVVTWDTAVTGATENSSLIQWASAAASFGVCGIALMDGSTAACTTNMLWYGPLSASKAVGVGDVFEIAASALDVTLD